MWLWKKWHCKLVHGWMVYTELALRWQQFHVAPAMQQPKSVISTPLQWLLKICTIKGYSHSFRITWDMCTVNLLESREQHYLKAMNKNKRSSEVQWGWCQLFSLAVCSWHVLGIYVGQPKVKLAESCQSFFLSVCVWGGGGGGGRGAWPLALKLLDHLIHTWSLAVNLQSHSFLFKPSFFILFHSLSLSTAITPELGATKLT